MTEFEKRMIELQEERSELLKKALFNSDEDEFGELYNIRYAISEISEMISNVVQELKSLTDAIYEK